MFLLAFNASSHAVEMSQMEWGTDRIGYDYRVLRTYGADPSICQNQCAIESQCRAWAFDVNTGDCWLKHGDPEPQARNDFVTGVKIVGDISSYAIDMSKMEEGISAAELSGW
jgi:hypothetical protein